MEKDSNNDVKKRGLVHLRDELVSTRWRVWSKACCFSFSGSSHLQHSLSKTNNASISKRNLHPGLEIQSSLQVTRNKSTVTYRAQWLTQRGHPRKEERLCLTDLIEFYHPQCIVLFSGQSIQRIALGTTETSTENTRRWGLGHSTRPISTQSVYSEISNCTSNSGWPNSSTTGPTWHLTEHRAVSGTGRTCNCPGTQDTWHHCWRHAEAHQPEPCTTTCPSVARLNSQSVSG